MIMPNLHLDLLYASVPLFACSGSTVQLPANVQGVVLREGVCPQHVKAENSDITAYHEAELSFSEVTIWGHDQLPQDHMMKRALEWMEISQALHGT